MAIRHVKEEFNRICEDYHEMREVLQELQDAVAEHVVSEERLKEITDQVELMKTNYMRWSRMMQLLDIPNRSEKEKKWKKRHRLSENIDRVENKKCLDNFQESVKQLKESK